MNKKSVFEPVSGGKVYMDRWKTKNKQTFTVLFNESKIVANEKKISYYKEKENQLYMIMIKFFFFFDLL